MAILLFRLRNVPDDEANDVRDLLSQHNIEFYETSAGNWGVSLPALWLRHDHDYPHARQLLDQYQYERSVRMREQYLADKVAGRADTTLGMLSREPLKVISYMALVLVVLYLSISIFY